MGYYVSGCQDNGSETVTCDDSEAQFWTLYIRDDAGLSQGIIDSVFREDAETAMAVYVERDALQERLSNYSMSAGQADQRKAESNAVRVALGFAADADDVAPCDLVDAIAALQQQVRALAADGDTLLNERLRLLEKVEAQTLYIAALEVERKAFEKRTPDSITREIRAQAVSNLPKVGDGKEQEAFEIYARSRNLDLSQHPLHYLFLDGKTNQARSAWRECLVYVSSQLPAGEQPCVNVE